MKKIVILSFIVATVILFISCSEVKREPGWVYMPDMAYSRAFETYSVTEADREALEKQGIYYSNLPVPGTIKRGELLPFPLAKDKDLDSTNYVASKQITNPLPTLDTVEKVEAERLFLVNCAICHGPKLDGNGPLYRNGDGPFPSKPATLVGDPKYAAMPEGQMFYSITYGRVNMGSYGSQLNSRQRWMVIDYIKSKQAAAKTAASATADSTAAKK
jgi:mono/diheme cytochrome c family protein